MWNKSTTVEGRWDYSIATGTGDMPRFEYGGHVTGPNNRGDYFAYDATTQLLGNYSRLEIAKKVVEEAARG